MMTSKWR